MCIRDSFSSLLLARHLLALVPVASPLVALQLEIWNENSKSDDRIDIASIYIVLVSLVTQLFPVRRVDPAVLIVGRLQ